LLEGKRLINGACKRPRTLNNGRNLLTEYAVNMVACVNARVGSSGGVNPNKTNEYVTSGNRPILIGVDESFATLILKKVLSAENKYIRRYPSRASLGSSDSNPIGLNRRRFARPNDELKNFRSLR